MGESEVSPLDAKLTLKPDLLRANPGLFLPYHSFQVYFYSRQNIVDVIGGSPPYPHLLPGDVGFWQCHEKKNVLRLAWAR